MIGHHYERAKCASCKKRPALCDLCNEPARYFIESRRFAKGTFYLCRDHGHPHEAADEGSPTYSGNCDDCDPWLVLP